MKSKTLFRLLGSLVVVGLTGAFFQNCAKGIDPSVTESLSVSDALGVAGINGGGVGGYNYYNGAGSGGGGGFFGGGGGGRALSSNNLGGTGGGGGSSYCSGVTVGSEGGSGVSPGGMTHVNFRSGYATGGLPVN